MVFSPRPRRRRTRHGGRDGVAIAAAALVRPWSAATVAAAAPGTVTEDLAVTIPSELEAQILRYHHVEKWPVGTIAKHLRVHHTTISRVLLQAGLPRILQHPKRSKADPFLPFIRATLERFPTLTASRLYAMVRERGYPGRPDHINRHDDASDRCSASSQRVMRSAFFPFTAGSITISSFAVISHHLNANQYRAARDATFRTWRDFGEVASAA